jgi:hypothetical protein
MAAQDITKTAIITPFGLFEYLFLPFGLRNAAQTFQRFMDSLFKHLPFVFCYLDIVIVSHNLEEHHREDSEFSPAEAVYGSKLILPGQLINTAESASLSFLSDLQTTMTGRPPPPTRHNAAPAPSTLPEELLLTCFILVRREGAQPPLSPIYDGPYRVL